MPVSEQIMELQRQVLALRISDWYDKVVSWQYALLIVLLLVPWIIWWKLVDRKRIIEIFAFGLLVSTVSSFFNSNGLTLMLWSYPYHLLPFSPRAYSFSLAVIPVAFMLIYQYFPKRTAFAVAITVLSAATAFIVQPLLKLANIYKLINWNYFYSFLALLMIASISGIIHHLVMQRALKKAPRTKSAAKSHSPTLSPAFKKQSKVK